MADPETILIVDDNSTNLKVLYKTLENRGCRLLVAKDGPTAINIAKKVRPELILLDVLMPEMNGFDVCQRLKDDPDTANSVVIFLSAVSDNLSKVKGLQIGGVDYITKPFQADEVLARVHTQIKLRRLEQQLAKRNAELEDENQQILHAVGDGIVGLNEAGHITSMNPMAESISGWSSANAVGEPLFSLGLFDAESEDDMPVLKACRDRKKLYVERQDLRRRNGELLPVSLSCSPSRGGAVMVLRDISEWLQSRDALHQAQKTLEAQRSTLAHVERLSTGGEMASGIAHEVNQPLTAISNYARVAKRMGPAADNLEDILDKIETQAERASEIIDKFRSFLRKPSEQRKPMVMNVALEKVLSLAEVDAHNSGVAIEFVPSPDELQVLADEVQFQQVALNLLRNAFEAVASSGDNKVVKVECYRLNSRCGFKVVDHGPGLSSELLDDLFTPFVSSKEGGMGVGLSISQAIVDAHGGDLRYEPTPGGGATFCCEFPSL